MRVLAIALLAWLAFDTAQATPLEMTTRHPNDISDVRPGAYALTGGVIVMAPGEQRDKATVLVRDGVIESVESGQVVPAGYQNINLNGAYVYPGLIDLYSTYGMPEVTKASGSRWSGPETLQTTKETAVNANEAIKSHTNAVEVFEVDDEAAKALRSKGFTTVLSFHPDGIARGTAAAVLTADGIANEVILADRAANHLSYDKGSSEQFMPVSRMGVIALLRQTYLDADWYAAQSTRPFADETLEAWIGNRELPTIMSAFDWKTLLLADKLGDEFGEQYIIRGGGDEYQRLDEVAATGAPLILDVNFPEAPEVGDPLTTDLVPLAQLKHWELAPYNLARVEAADINFVITAHESGDSFWKNLRAAIKRGLAPDVALSALTTRPAELMAQSDRVGTIEAGKLANFVITDGDLFTADSEARILQTWIKGQPHDIAEAIQLTPGTYELTFDGEALEVLVTFKSPGYKAVIKSAKEDKAPEAKLELSLENDYVNLQLKRAGSVIRFGGWQEGDVWRGEGRLADGSETAFELKPLGTVESGKQEQEQAEAKANSMPGAVIYPFTAYGQATLPEQETLLIQGATVWTNEAEGILLDADVLVQKGKISRVGKDLSSRNARIIDGRGMHVTAGIIDEHSHIALDGVNEFAVNAAMVRMADVVDSEDVSIYRNLSGGVTAAQLLHGSANPIGGQSALIKMRWGQTPEGLLIEDADEFIKFALGENVKRSSNKDSIRYPQTRMGVEQVYIDAFTEARQYEAEWAAYEKLSGRAKAKTAPPRRDLVLDAMVEILNGERYVTSHSYVQSEINMLMHVAERFGFNINTFTHILEGYKVADKMAAHGVGGSTFSDWWAYKWEVRYAIPYNATLMHEAGVTVAINSDDAEMARRLNHEAAKSIRHGGMSEEEALKMVTLNPAKLLHLDHRMGSIKAGKDADIVLWSDHPLSVYSRAEMTLVDGKVLFHRARDAELHAAMTAERNRLIQKILAGEGDSGAGQGAKPDGQKLQYHHHELESLVDQLERTHD